MYCAVCKCEFIGWKDSCPNCKTPLLDAPPPEIESQHTQLAYDTLLERVGAAGGSLSIELNPNEVGMQKQRAFPYLGYGYAWAKKMHGTDEDILIELTASEVGMDKSWSFPYFGYGFAWVKKMDGHFGGNPITLTARRVERETRRAFPYQGYGFAWTAEMRGACGIQLTARMEISNVSKKQEYGFPYFGFGYAWENRAILTLTMAA